MDDLHAQVARIEERIDAHIKATNDHKSFEVRQFSALVEKVDLMHDEMIRASSFLGGAKFTIAVAWTALVGVLALFTRGWK